MNESQKILVVGATGQLGGQVVARLRSEGRAVRALVRPTSNTDPLKAQGVELVFGDLSRREDCMRACEGVDSLIATASSIVPRRGDQFGARDIEWYENLIGASREHQLRRIVYISAFTTEDDAQVPEFLIKRRIEKIIENSGIEYQIFRGAAFMDVYFAAMGSSVPLAGVANPTLERGFWATRLFRALTRHLVESWGWALVPGDGHVRHAFISVDDVADILVKGLDLQPACQTIDIGGPRAPTWNEVVGLYRSNLGRTVRPIHIPLGLLAVLKALLGPLSPGAANLMAILKLLGTEDYAPDNRALMKKMAVHLTDAEDFIREKVALYRQT